MKEREALSVSDTLKLALEALKQIDEAMPFPVAKLAIMKAEEALAQRTWVHATEWQGLTDEDKKEYVAQDFGGNRLDAMDWAEKRLKEKNTHEHK